MAKKPNRNDKAKRLSTALPQLIAGGELHLDDMERQDRAGKSRATPADTQRRHDILFLRGITQIKIAKAALDHSGLEATVYETLAATVEEDEARQETRQSGYLPVVPNVVATGMDGIHDREAVVTSLEGVWADAELEVEERSAAAGLLTVLGIEVS